MYKDGFPYLVAFKKDPIPALVYNDAQLGYVSGKEPFIIEVNSSEASLRIALLVAKATMDYALLKLEETK